MELLHHLAEAVAHVSWPSLFLGLLSLAVLLLGKRFIPRFPMAIAVMAAGVVLTGIFHVQDYGVALLDQVDPWPSKVFPTGFFSGGPYPGCRPGSDGSCGHYVRIPSGCQ